MEFEPLNDLFYEEKPTRSHTRSHTRSRSPKEKSMVNFTLEEINENLGEEKIGKNLSNFNIILGRDPRTGRSEILK